MSINHNRIKVSDLETNQPDKILTTDNNGELKFTDINSIKIDSYNALDYTEEGKALDARQGKLLKDLIDDINTVLASDNINLNTLQKLVDAIETVQNSLNTLVINDLTTGGTTKALTAEMGKVLQNNKVDKVAGKNLISDTEITRLGTLSNYTHPANHPPGIITQDASNRFVTDTEKANWNAKQSSLGFVPENSANKNIASGYAGLGPDGKLISSQLPSITLNDTFVTASQTAMLALAVQTGDIAVRTDLNKSFILKGSNPTLLSDWQELLTPTSAVTTVFGRSGAVVSQTADYTADQITETTTRKFQSANQQTFNDATSSIQTQINSKQANIATGTPSQYFRGDKTWQTLDKTTVGLANVDNTADAAKNVLSATKLTTPRTINGTAFDGSANITINAADSTPRIASSEKGIANGVATLDASGIILTTQLPSYVDDVIEFTNLAGFPATGESGKIYIAKDTNKTYRWGGSAYVYITSGAVDSVAGKTGIVTLTKADIGLASVDNTSDLNKPVSTATQTALSSKADLLSPPLTGVPTAPTASVGTNNTQIATTAFVVANSTNIPSGTPTQYYRGDKTWQTLNTAMVPEVTNLYFSNTRAIGSILTGYASAPGTIAATDTILQAINKLNGNDAQKANSTSPSLLGTPTAPTAPAGTNTTQLATTAFVIANSTTIPSGTPTQYYRGDQTWQTLNTAMVPEVTNLYFSNARAIGSILTGYASAPGTIAATDTILQAINKLNGNDAQKANSTSPSLLGTPTAPTAPAGTNTTQLATTAFVTSASNLLATKVQLNSYLPLTGGVITGSTVFNDYAGFNNYTSFSKDVEINQGATFSKFYATGMAPPALVAGITDEGNIFAQTYNAKMLPVYANNAAAVTGGLLFGDFYRTSTGVLMVRY